MKTQIHHRIGSGLPEDDAHPYRTGAWRPQTPKYDAWNLDVVGAIPDDLSGVYLRNTEPAREDPRWADTMNPWRARCRG